MMAVIATSKRPDRHCLQARGQITEKQRDQVDDVAFTLDAAIDPQHAAAENGAAVLLEDFRPDDWVSDACFVLKRDEQDAFGGGAICDLM
ncbi:MAG: hypothetical protein R3C46_06155 [Hyphomonadaceae bacterium]